MVLAYVSIEGWIIHPDVNGLFNGSDEGLVPSPPHYRNYQWWYHDLWCSSGHILGRGPLDVA